MKCIRATCSSDKWSGVYFKSLDSTNSTSPEANRVCIVLKGESAVYTSSFLSTPTAVSVTPPQLKYFIQSCIVLYSLDLFIDLIGCNDDLMKTTQMQQHPLQIHILVHRTTSSPGQPPLNSLRQTVLLDISDMVRLYSIFIFLLSQTKPITQAPLPVQIVKAGWKE